MNVLKGRSTVVSRSIESVCFGCYTRDEAQAMSVKQITNPILLDNLSRPAPGGLYDPALGPLEQYGTCPTCGEPALHCPGHFGHLDLALPVYNPIFFTALVKILRRSCLFCHHFKLNSKRVQNYATRLELIFHGFIVEALARKPQDLEGLLHSETRPRTTLHQTSHQIIAARELIDKLMAEIPKSKCENCGADNPAITSEGVGKIFQAPLHPSKLSSNLMRGKQLDLATLIGVADTETVTNPHGDTDVPTEEATDLPNTMERNEESGVQSTIDLCSRLRFLTTLEVKKHLSRLWKNEQRLCSLIWDAQNWVDAQKYSTMCNSSALFFLETVLVTPSRFRPPNKLHGTILEHPMNTLYVQLLESNIKLTEFLRSKKEDASLTAESINTGHATGLWLDLQNCVNKLLDSSSAVGKKNEQHGVRQVLEKKDGLFRMNLMGKRVNFSCRSVISPDPYIAVNEIGIPPYFATHLTYPERVTHWNVDRLRNAVVNGAHKYPGATHVEDEQGVVVSLQNLSKLQRIALSKTLLSRPGSSSANSGNASYSMNSDGTTVSGKIVYRHLSNGDAVLVNRQPTLHKPSIMGHIARVLKGEKTLRLHYANCSTYNADFDGDEMNVHFPQDEIGRAEAYQVVNANQQYVVPTSGEPIRGLIQDHIVSAVLLTKKDSFLTKEEYQQLVFSACISSAPTLFLKGKNLGKVGFLQHDRVIVSVPPAVIKPKRFWTGKQVITTILNYLTHGRPPFSVKKAGRVPTDYWGRTSGEAKLRIKENELLHGVIDKAQFGKYGLVHAFAEFYGADAAGHLLSVLSRLFTSYLQMHGFTCGVADLLLISKAEDYRKKKLMAVDHMGEKVCASFVAGSTDVIKPDISTDMHDIQLEIEKSLQSGDDQASVHLDRLMFSALNGITSDVNNALFPFGLLKSFPQNCLSLMTTTGAKGGLVNFTQISSLLGQQELEGKRVPRMSSGKTLPSFPPWDTAARAGGFIADRFLTGLKPQEYYFHCMAGRDGLVDTAVKTSRSGYLQRCLVKNLESLRVHYDYTVRDSDGSIIQFCYGEDGIDVAKSGYLSEFKALAKNHQLVSERFGGKCSINIKVDGHENKDLNDSAIEDVSELFANHLQDYMKTLSKRKRRDLQLLRQKERSRFIELMRLHFLSCCALPGEAVGVVAAQSIGEPSTQMTLNTFHFAGKGEMNVTLGIPRLREILMVAARAISTPVMTCPLKHGRTREDAEKLATRLRKIRLVDMVEKVEVSTLHKAMHGNSTRKMYKVKLTLYPFDKHPPHLNLQPYECEQVIREHFVALLAKEMSKAVSLRCGEKVKDAIKVMPLSQVDEVEVPVEDEDSEMRKMIRSRKKFEDGEVDEDEAEEVAEEDGTDAEKRRCQGTDERGYDDDEIDNSQVAEDNASEEAKENERYGQEEFMELPNQLEMAAATVSNPIKKSKEKVKKEQISVTHEGLVFEVNFSMKHNAPHILLPQIVETVLKQITIRSVTGINQCSVIDFNNNGNTPALQTEGVNFEGFWVLADELELSRLTTNDIASVLEVYGVEAARATIVSEVRNVFMSYGITVNVRHLSLIADFMTYLGGFRPCNRVGIDSNSSPFLKISFETASRFLVEASLEKQCDHLMSPSSRIILGQVVDIGTGGFDLLQNIKI